ncbi:hypothetical protein WN51_08188 [Melipona quadrifasciata]|uniref:Uncharacterized protein n=1 Tax=Melipona quadrifasciata TaxID=166423 RepID=A0A0M8ZNA7_9HYME|nr:hypothetical protein WN51_08188 [Melipona quadrifasciata]
MRRFVPIHIGRVLPANISLRATQLPKTHPFTSTERIGELSPISLDQPPEQANVTWCVYQLKKLFLQIVDTRHT